MDDAAVASFEWETVILAIDDREDYRAVRELAIGFAGVRPHVPCFTRRGTDERRVICPRKANKREVRRYVDG